MVVTFFWVGLWEGCENNPKHNPPVHTQRFTPNVPMIRTRAQSQCKNRLSRMGISMLKIRRSRDRLIFSTRIPILVRWHLYVETVPRCRVRNMMKRFLHPPGHYLSLFLQYFFDVECATWFVFRSFQISFGTSLLPFVLKLPWFSISDSVIFGVTTTEHFVFKLDCSIIFVEYFVEDKCFRITEAVLSLLSMLISKWTTLQWLNMP